LQALLIDRQLSGNDKKQIRLILEVNMTKKKGRWYKGDGTRQKLRVGQPDFPKITFEMKPYEWWHGIKPR